MRADPPQSGFVDELIGELRREGVAEEAGEFSLDRELARRKLDDFQLADRDRYLLEWVQAAVCKGAAKIDIEVDADDVRMTFGGDAFTLGDFDLLYNALFSARDSPEARARQQLALGLGAVLAKSPRKVRIVSGRGTDQVELLIRPGTPEQFGRPPSPVTLPEDRTTRIAVKLPLSRRVVSRKLTTLRSTLPEVAALEDCLYATAHIRLNEEPLHSRFPLSQELSVPLGGKQWRGEVGFDDVGDPGQLLLLRDGVRIETIEEADWPGVTAVVEGPRLRKDLSQTRIVRDEAFAQARQVVMEAILRGAQELLDAAEGGAPVKSSLRFPVEVLQRLAAVRIQREHLAAENGKEDGEGRLTAMLREAEIWHVYSARGDYQGRVSLLTIAERAERDGRLLACHSPRDLANLHGRWRAKTLCVQLTIPESEGYLRQLFKVQVVEPTVDDEPPEPLERASELGYDERDWSPHQRRAAMARLPFELHGWPPWLSSRLAYLRGLDEVHPPLSPITRTRTALAPLRWLVGHRTAVPADRWELAHQCLSHVRSATALSDAYLFHDESLRRWGALLPLEGGEELGLLVRSHYERDRLVGAEVILWHDETLPDQPPLTLHGCAQTLADGSGQVMRLEYRPDPAAGDPTSALAEAVGHALRVAVGQANMRSPAHSPGELTEWTQQEPSPSALPESLDLALHNHSMPSPVRWTFLSQPAALWSRALLFWGPRLGLVGAPFLPGLPWWARVLPGVVWLGLGFAAYRKDTIRPRFPRLWRRETSDEPQLALRLLLDDGRLSLAPFPNLVVDLRQPFEVELTVDGNRAPESSFVVLGLRQSSRETGTTRLEVAVVAVVDAQAPEVGERSSSCPVLSPGDFRKLWAVVHHHALAQGSALPWHPLGDPVW